MRLGLLFAFAAHTNVIGAWHAGQTLVLRRRRLSPLHAVRLSATGVGRTGASASGLKFLQPLGLITCDSQEVMTPGDTGAISLHSGRHAAIVDHANRHSQGHLGMLLISGASSVASWMPLLRIVETRDGASSAHPWAEVRCVGRVKLRNPEELRELSAAAMGEHALTARVAEYADATMTDETIRAAEDAVGHLIVLRSSCLDLMAQLSACSAAAAGAPQCFDRDLEVSRAQRLEMGRRERLQAPACIAEGSLGERTGRLRNVLARRGLDEAPSQTLEDYYTLWNVADEREACLQLVSFAVCGWFGPHTRTQAVRCRSTASRLELARRVLRQRKQLLSAKLALHRLEAEL
jgi:hypothetical protein